MIMNSIMDLLDRQRSALDPDLIAEMSNAFDAACLDLNLSADDTTAREVVANRILGLALQGEHSAADLLKKLHDNYGGAL